jgi:purine-nucleoside phosphorylase
MNNLTDCVTEACNYINSITTIKPGVGVVLGTGLGSLINITQVTHTIPYAQIPHFPQATIEFHKGNLVFGTIGNTQVVIMQGRFHYYEGYSMQQVTFGVRVLMQLGVQNLLLSNAAGGISPAYKKGHLVILDDHINMQPENPLRGLTAPQYGNPFVDMCKPYNEQLNNLLQAEFLRHKLPVHMGVYVAVQGPNLETRGEYRYLRNAGATLVGMSTVPEVIVANHIGLPCAAVSVITDECDPDNLAPVNITEIIETAHKADEKLSSIFANVIKQL